MVGLQYSWTAGIISLFFVKDYAVIVHFIHTYLFTLFLILLLFTADGEIKMIKNISAHEKVEHALDVSYTLSHI